MRPSGQGRCSFIVWPAAGELREAGSGRNNNRTIASVGYQINWTPTAHLARSARVLLPPINHDEFGPSSGRPQIMMMVKII